MGSGYWIGKQIFKNLLINSNIVSIDNDLSEVFDSVKQKLDISSIESLAQKLEDSNESIAQIASIAESIIAIAKNGNDLALSIIQEATKNTLREDLKNHLQTSPTNWCIRQAGHALIVNGLMEQIENWLESCP